MKVNEVLVLMRSVRQRSNSLKGMRDKVSVKETWRYAENNQKVITPEYDVKKADKKIAELEKFLFVADAAIKTSNALTDLVGFECDIDSLLAPIE